MELESNIKKFYIYTFLRNFMLILPIFVLFYLENGLSLTEIMLLVVVISAVSIILEVPSGVFADLYGRKTAIVIGSVVCAAGYLIRALSYDFLMFAVAVITISVGFAFVSGADQALLYDTLFNLKRQSEFKKIVGTAFSINMASMASASLIGGFLAVYGLRFVHFIVVIPVFLSALVAFMFVEPKIHKKVIGKKYFEHLKDSIRFSIAHKKVRSLILYSGFMMGIMMVSHIFYQPYMQMIGIAVASFGIFYALFLLTAAITSKFAHSIEDYLGERVSTLIIPIILVIQFFLLSKVSIYWGVLIFFLCEFAWGFLNPVVSNYINLHIPSEKRATVISINSLVGKVFWLILSPLFGWFADFYSLQTALMIGAVFTSVITIIIFIFWEEEKTCVIN